MDIATCYATVNGAPPHPGTVAIFLQDPSNPGKFLPPATFSVGNDPVSIAVADLNGDSKPDIMTANTMLSATGAGSNSVSVLLQDSSHPGQFSAGGKLHIRQHHQLSRNWRSKRRWAT